MTYRIRTLAAVAAALSVSLLVAPSAQAEDQRPCVSKREFYGARDFGIPLMRDPMTKVPARDLDSIGRLTLEDRWDVRHRGTTVKRTLDNGAGQTWALGHNPMVRVKMYRSCGDPLSERQVYVGFHKDTGMVLWTLRWKTLRFPTAG